MATPLIPGRERANCRWSKSRSTSPEATSAPGGIWPGRPLRETEELVKEGRWASVGELVGHSGEELADGGAMGQAPAVAAGMDNQGAKTREASGRRSDGMRLAVQGGGGMLAIQLGQDAQGGAAAAGPQAIGVGHDEKARLRGEQAGAAARLDLRLVGGGLARVAGREDAEVPGRDEGALAAQRGQVLLPVVLVALLQEGQLAGREAEI